MDLIITLQILIIAAFLCGVIFTVRIWYFYHMSEKEYRMSWIKHWEYKATINRNYMQVCGVIFILLTMILMIFT